VAAARKASKKGAQEESNEAAARRGCRPLMMAYARRQRSRTEAVGLRFHLWPCNAAAARGLAGCLIMQRRTTTVRPTI
jgi:hypothetical protein